MTLSMTSRDTMISPAAVRFSASRVEKIIRDVLDAYLHNVRYDPNRCSQLSYNMCTVIKEQTKQLLQRVAADRHAAAAAAAPEVVTTTTRAALTNGDTNGETPNSTSSYDDSDSDEDDDDDEDRWKLVVHIVLGQDSDQPVLLSSRCIWNADTDCLASATYRNDWLFAVATVYGLRCGRDDGDRVATTKALTTSSTTSNAARSTIESLD